jgi:hypothetical protein
MHLTMEALARLVDEAPTRDESAHLEQCDRCRRELEALRDQREDLANLPAIQPTVDAWDTLETRLRAEGLIRNSGHRSLPPAWTRAAAAVVLFLAGGATGFVMRGTAAPSGGQNPAALAGTGSGGKMAAQTAKPHTVQQADQALQAAQEAYLSALSNYAELTDQPTAGDPAVRLAALDNIVLTSQAALDRAPADPVINGYLLTALAQRDAMARQVSQNQRTPVF